MGFREIQACRPEHAARLERGRDAGGTSAGDGANSPCMFLTKWRSSERESSRWAKVDGCWYTKKPKWRRSGSFRGFAVSSILLRLSRSWPPAEF